MADSTFAINVVLDNEGGLTDNPHDPGGITNYGITIPFMNSHGRCDRYFDHPAPATRDDIRNLTREKAIEIYREEIWNQQNYGQIVDNQVATKIFDCGVNMGEKWGNVLAQQSCNRLGQNIAVDGQIGPKSVAALNTVPADQFLREMRMQMEERYYHIVHDRPESGVFLRGWLRRARWPFPV